MTMKKAATVNLMGANLRCPSESRQYDNHTNLLALAPDLELARPERFELPTYSSGGCRSIQLSYGRAPIF